MKKLLLFLGIVFAAQLNAQLMSNNLAGVMVPKYMGSTKTTTNGDSTRLPVVFRLRVFGLQPNTKYQYVTRGGNAADINGNVYMPGAGTPIYFDSNGTSWKLNSTLSLGSGKTGNDTFTTNFIGEYEGWFGFMYSTDSRFTAGKYIYPIVSAMSINGNDSFKQYCQDSIKVLSFGSATGSAGNSGSFIGGLSYAKDKSFVALYDQKNAAGLRPLSITYIEKGNLDTIGSTKLMNYLPKFYKKKVLGVSGAWGTIIPNDLPNGIRRIENYTFGGKSAFASLDSNALWGPNNKNTKNPTVGLTTPIWLENDFAPLVPTKVEFWARTSTTNEGVGTYKVFVTRKFSNSENQTVQFAISGGDAIKGTDYTVAEPKTITFKPGVDNQDTTVTTIIDDNIAEVTETITYRLNTPVNCIIGVESAHTISITDNDIANISISPLKQSIDESAGLASFKIKIDKAVGLNSKLRLVVKYKDDSTFIPQEFILGKSGVDSIFNLGKSTGADSIVIKAKVIDDTDIDRDDSLIMSIRSITGVAVPKDSLSTLVVRDNDGPSFIQFIGTTLTVKESDPSFDVKFRAVKRKAAGGDFTFRLYTAKSTAQNPTDIKFSPSSKIINFTSASPDTMVVNIPLVNDDIFEPTERLLFGLASMSNIVILQPDSFKVWIKDDDLPTYKINKLNKQSGVNKTADSLNVKCKVSGTVYGGNLQSGGGLQFTIRDNTGAMGVYSATKSFGYSVKQGDSVTIQGTVGQIQGMVEMINIDTVYKVGGNCKLVSPLFATSINESHESNLIQVDRMKLVDPTEWPTTALAANTNKMVRIISTSGVQDTLNIDAETDIDGTPAPTGYIMIKGLGSQFDNTAPYNAKYCITPRDLTDISAAKLPVINFYKTTDQITELADSFRMDFTVIPADETFAFDLVCLGGTAVSPQDYDFKTIRTTVVKNNNFFYLKANISDDNVSDGTKTLSFAIRNLTGAAYIGKDSIVLLTILDDEPSAVKNFAESGIKMFPNPTVGSVNIHSQNVKLSGAQVFDLSGRMISDIKFNNVNLDYKFTAPETAGMYVVKLISESGQIYSDRLMVK